MRMRRTIGLSLALLVLSTAGTKQVHAATQQQQPQSVKAKATKADAPAKRHRASSHQRSHIAASRHSHATRQRPTAARPDRYITQTAPTVAMLRVVGRREVGSAAWYGGRHIGRRTASGDPLDTVRPTAAHRSLPLNSLARVTNLNNGLTVVVTVTDRGPVSHARLIDLSPHAADQLDMKSAGIVPVAVEPVIAVASNSGN